MNFVIVLSQPTITAYLNQRVPSEQRATVISLTNLVRSLILIPSAPLLGLLADRVSTSAAYWAGGIIIAVLGLPLLLLWMPSFRSGGDLEPVAETATVPGE
jgi:MFS family permease